MGNVNHLKMEPIIQQGNLIQYHTIKAKDEEKYDRPSFSIDLGLFERVLPVEL